MPAEAQAGRRRAPQVDAPQPVPDLEEVLRKAGWTITPELSAAYSQPGDIFDGGNTLIKKGLDCFEAKVHEGAYASMEVNRSLESGVKMRVSVASVRAGVGLTKKMVFGTPTHRQIALLDLVPTAECAATLRAAQARGLPVASWMVITEALSATIQKQECGEFNVEAGTFVVSGDLSVQQACMQTSLEPVAVAYKLVSVTSVIGTDEAPLPVLPQTVDAPLADDQLMLELRQLQAEQQEKKKAQEAADIALAQARRTALERAKRTWALLEPLLETDPTSVKPKLLDFIDRYSNFIISLQLPTGPVQEPLIVPEVAIARRALKQLKSASLAAANPVISQHDIKFIETDIQPEGAKDGARLSVADVEVGQGLYEAVMGRNPSYFWKCGPTCPVERVNWREAIKFCNKLSEREGLPPAYSEDSSGVKWDMESPGYRLLTAKEWVAVAGYGSEDPYPGSDDSRQVAWTMMNSDKRTHPARGLRQNRLGVWDLGGNVAEWVWTAGGPTKETRGGGWSQSPIQAEILAPGSESETHSGDYIGIRLARSINEQ